jgi:hypothetical protein
MLAGREDERVTIVLAFTESASAIEMTTGSVRSMARRLSGGGQLWRPDAVLYRCTPAQPCL